MASVFAGKFCTISVAYQLEAVLEKEDVRKSVTMWRAEPEKWRIYREPGPGRRWIVEERYPGPRLPVMERFGTRLECKIYIEEVAMRKAVTTAIDAMFNKGQRDGE